MSRERRAMQRARRCLRLSLLALLALCALPTSPASASFSPATLISGTELIPFQRAEDPALSHDGEYVAFRGTLAGEPGIYRRNLRTGEVQLVAGVKLQTATHSEQQPIASPDAIAPSISEDGRYIAFTTTADLEPLHETTPGARAGEPEADRGCPEVYVRDMQRAIGDPDAYTLAAALNGSQEGISYQTCQSPAGAQAAAGVALSGDGQRVAFTVLSPSNLSTGAACPPQSPAQPGCPPVTEPSQVVVRDLATQQTILVSESIDAEGHPSGAPAPGGGAYPSNVSEQSFPSVGGFGEQPSESAASISADGSTVAWMGTNVPEQVSNASDVSANMAGSGGPGKEVEPLWRRIADGPSAPIKRLLGDAGLKLYFRGYREGIWGVEAGSLFGEGSTYFLAPALSADGNTAVTLSNAPTAANEASYYYAANFGPSVLPTDAYAVSVDDSPASEPRVTPLTATPNYAQAGLGLSSVEDLAISPDGSRVSFETARTRFALSPPTLISPPASETGAGYIFEANLALGTLQQVTSTFDGSPPNGSPSLMSFSGDGLTLAFASAATNLIFGTPTSSSLVYLTRETATQGQVAVESVGSVPGAPVPTPAWVLSATASAEPDGSVLLDAQVPGAGALSVRALAQLTPATQARAAHAKRRSPVRRGRAGAAGAAHRHSRRAKRTETLVASTRVPVSEAAELRVRLHVSRAFRELVLDKLGLYALLDVSFEAAGHRSLSEVIPVTFRVRTAPVHTRRGKPKP